MAETLAEGSESLGIPFADPADHLIAGGMFALADGSCISLRPAPRRSAGLDLTGLSIGCRHRFVETRDVWSRIHPRASLAATRVNFDGAHQIA